MRLALALGQPNVTGMLESMTFEDFLEWRAFDLISPIGDRRGDWQAATICSAILNAAFIRGGSKVRISTQECLLEFKDTPTEVPGEAPKPAPVVPGWQRMKMIAQMHFALSKTRTTAKATQQKKLQKKRARS